MHSGKVIGRGRAEVHANRAEPSAAIRYSQADRYAFWAGMP